MKTKDIIDQSITAAASLDLNSRVHDLELEKTKLLDPRYRVAFTGQFKTGKSTIINRLILKESVLFTDVMEATSIPVEIEYSDTKRLELFRYEKKSIRDDNLPNALEYTSGVAKAEIIENPTAEDVKKHTSKDTSEDRAELASTYSHARLLWPTENLRRFTVVDTPGVNTPNEAVATATYRFLPECDLVIYVALPRQLSQVDLQFLKGKVFDSGITRAMIFLNYDPRFTDGDSAQLQKIKADVEVTLKQIGRDYIPVVMAEVPRMDSGNPGALAQATQSPDAVGDWLNTSAPAVSSSSVSILENDLIQFIQKNIQPGREEKTRIRLRRILEATLTETQIELGLLEQDARTRQQTVADIGKVQKQSYRDNQAIKEDFLVDFHALQNKHFKHLLKGFQKIEDEFISKLDGCGSLGDIQGSLSTLKPILQLDVETLALDTRKLVIEDLKDLEGKYVLKLQDVAQEWRDLDITLKVDGGFLEKTPAFMVAGLDILLAVLLSPFPFFIDIPLRLLLNGFPTIAKWLPAGVAGDALKGWVKKSANTQFTRARAEIENKLQEAYVEAEQTLDKNWERQLAEQQQTIQSATQRATSPTDSTRLNLLRTAADTFKHLLNQLPA